ncbi:alpha/beta fold hydrolase [Nocardioides sp. zg-579]|uniref:Alpha/beta fold hydrolase n=1 Tax=Nocardioides marmotae TaxID=2663857 RepID=A0A6I3JCQ4_9ACTN|nr:alpha/beta hydrolase [Nocardioides marmotae]MCR6032242.1 alpha/beta fold hydrolase [Gordonia jinghuaiqii]MTB95890.1 alpha/beta fold hydrolase [Nocardioides marmotae]QKE02764.1 alpha/beta hydrolase [Nocardioides marmotae]
MRHTLTTHDGLTLHVTTHGRADAAVTVLLAHCWTADEEVWHYQVRDLLDQYGADLRVVTWDARGHGRSEKAPLEACTIENLARDLGAVVDAHAANGPLVLAGHSIGGMTLMALPEIRPDLVHRIRGLLFVSTSSGELGSVTLGLPDVGSARKLIPHVLALRARLLTRRERRRTPSIERYVVNRLLFGEPLRLRDAGLATDQLICCPPATMEGFYRDLMAHERLAGLAAYDDVPAVVLVGSADRLTPPPHARRLAGGIRGARLLVAPGAGHYLPLERSDLVSEHLVALVEGARAERSGGHRLLEGAEAAAHQVGHEAMGTDRLG